MGQLTMKITREFNMGTPGIDVDAEVDYEVVVDYDYEPALGPAIVRECAVADDPDHLLDLTDDEMDRASTLALEQENEE